jgi:hypothetical protein
MSPSEKEENHLVIKKKKKIPKNPIKIFFKEITFFYTFSCFKFKTIKNNVQSFQVTTI